MRHPTWVLCAAALAACGEAVDDEAPLADSAETIVTYGHGTFVGVGGRELAPSEAVFRATQRAYIARLEAKVGDAARAEGQRIRREDPDALLADARYIDWLVEQAAPIDRATIRAVNGAMRNLRLTKLGRPAAAAFTFNGGPKYIDECAANGVPIPPPVFRESAGWRRLGNFDGKEVIAQGEVPELWMYTSTSPRGVCLALPRFYPGTTTIDVLGLICLGTDGPTPKACFWDTPKGTDWSAGPDILHPIERPITQFVGGWDLDANAQGVCSDCHAGENPFIVHPLEPAFADARRQFGAGWYQPLVHPNWPQNPGPSSLLDPIGSTEKCTRCHHRSGEGRRFPRVSRELPGYCNTVLSGVAFPPHPEAGFDGAWQRTMPPGGDWMPYRGDLDELWRACRDDEPIGGKFTTPPWPLTPSSFLSRPRLVGPLYACAQRIAVRDAMLDARVRVTVTHAGVPTVYEQVATRTVEIVFDLSSALQIDDTVTVEQILGGMASSQDTLTVRDVTSDHPAGLPAPSVDPTEMYQCSSVIAVRHIPGATLQVQVNGGFDAWYIGAGDWSALVPGKAPFAVGDKFRARITMCPSDTPSPWSPSDGATARTAPATLSTATLEPARTFAGQRLVTVANLTNGTKTSMTISGASAGMFSTPVSWLPDFNLGRALGDGEVVSATQELCPFTPPTTVTLPPTSKCSELPAPRVDRAIAGTDYIVMAEWVPGARVFVFAGGVEIGDGSGSVITLARPLVAGETIAVQQRIGDNCNSLLAHVLTVR